MLYTASAFRVALFDLEMRERAFRTLLLCFKVLVEIIEERIWLAIRMWLSILFRGSSSRFVPDRQVCGLDDALGSPFSRFVCFISRFPQNRILSCGANSGSGQRN